MLLNVSERTLRRYIADYKKKGGRFIKHGNHWRRPWNKFDPAVKDKVWGLIREKYFDLNVVHLSEKLLKEQNLKISPHTLRRWAHEIDMVKLKHRRKKRKHVYRERMSQTGLMLQMDGSTHEWFGGFKSCLISTIDDATSGIPYAEFFHGEDTMSCMIVLQKVIEKYGLFKVLYVDRAGIYGGPKRVRFSQVTRALKELGISIYYASSPQGKGRVERSYRTLQDRLIPELRLAGIKHFPGANRYLQEEFLPKQYSRFVVPPQKSETAYRPISSDIQLKEIFCIKEWRTIRSDHTISWRNELYVVPSKDAWSMKGQKIEFRTYQDFTERVFHYDQPIELKKVSSTDGDGTIRADIIEIGTEELNFVNFGDESEGADEIDEGESLVREKFKIADFVPSVKAKTV
jgi:transposase